MDKKPNYKYIYLTAELEGWEAPHWCEDKIADDDIEYVRSDVLAERDAEIKEMRGLLENFRTSSLIPSDVAVHKIRDYLKTGGCGE